jgi:tripeptidyl-peptidase-1
LEAGDVSVVPETISKLYNKGAHTAEKITQGAFEFQDLTAFSPSDLATFFSKTGVQVFNVEKHFGPFVQNPPQAESTLDVQYIGSTGTGATNWYFTSSGWMYEFSEDFSADNKGFDVVSMSYGWSEADQCQIASGAKPCQNGGSSKDFVDTVNANFQKIGAAGVTVLASSGDSGAHGRSDGFCSNSKVNPAFPAASPYITAVGATQFKQGSATTTGATEPICQSELQCATGGTEIVCSNAQGALITSGGGFSVFSKRPSYQDAAVTAYLAKSGVTPAAADFNAAGRGYPDVAALGHNYYIELQGQAQAVDGTSASCPVFAGIMSIVNSARVKAGKSKLGFANPSLYKIAAENPAAFNDITEGNNLCTETLCCKTGFYATAGWDATTGLGSPDISKLVEAAVAL